jgi:hypothetical protein
MIDETEKLYQAQESRRIAEFLFPDETWIYLESGIYIATSRIKEKIKEKAKWDKEYAQVKILVDRGSTAYFLPEISTDENGQKCPDLVLNGVVTEMKKVSGQRETVGVEFARGYRQGASLIKKYPELNKHSVYIWLLSDISIGSIKAKIAGELKNRLNKGSFICYFENIQTLYKWEYDELRSIIGQKNHPVQVTEPGSAKETIKPFLSVGHI